MLERFSRDFDKINKFKRCEQNTRLLCTSLLNRSNRGSLKVLWYFPGIFPERTIAKLDTILSVTSSLSVDNIKSVWDLDVDSSVSRVLAGSYACSNVHLRGTCLLTDRRCDYQGISLIDGFSYACLLPPYKLKVLIFRRTTTSAIQIRSYLLYGLRVYSLFLSAWLLCKCCC